MSLLPQPALRLLLATEDTEAYRLVKASGVAFFSVLAILGIIYCIVRMTRPTVSRKCYGSLMVILFIGPLAGIAGQMSRENRLVVGIGAAVLLVSILSSILLAILGFVELESPGSRRREGRVPAVLALVFCGLFGVLFTVGVSAGISETLLRSQLGARPSSPTTPIVRKEFRYSLRPQHPWVEFEPKRVNALASAAFLRRRPEVYFMVIAEKWAEGVEPSMDTFVAAVKANLMAQGPEARVLEEKPEEYKGRSGIKLICQARFKNLDFVYRYWLLSHEGFAYQLVAWGALSQRESVLSEAQEVFKTFEILPGD